jgi:hypothetical protein
VLAAVALTAVAEARTALVKERSRLRAEPNAQSQVLTWLDGGTRVEVVRENAGWAEVEAPGGRRGHIWGEYLANEPAAELRKAPDAGNATLADDVRALRADVTALRERVESAGGSGEFERLRGEVERVAAAQRDLARRLDERKLPIAPADPPPTNGGPGGGSLFFLVVLGAVLGWGASRLAQRGRDRRQRNRLRF